MILERLKEVPPIEDDKQVRLKESGNIIEIMSSNTRSKGGYITKLSSEIFVDNRTGEVKEFKHNVNRASDLQNVAKSLAMGRDMLNANIKDVSKCRWVTLTYSLNMTDPKKLLFDFKNFNKQCRAKYGHYEYITAAEPQGRGAWHLHCVLIFESKAPYMDNKTVSDLWKQGFVTIKKLDNVDNVGAYLTAYLGDMELTEARSQGIQGGEQKTVDYEENGEKKSKSYIKGARLYMYPVGFHIFRWSKGCQKPIVSECTYKEAKEKACDGTQTFSKAVTIRDEESDFTNTLVYEYYNRIRVKNQ